VVRLGCNERVLSGPARTVLQLEVGVVAARALLYPEHPRGNIGPARQRRVNRGQEFVIGGYFPGPNTPWKAIGNRMSLWYFPNSCPSRPGFSDNDATLRAPVSSRRESIVQESALLAAIQQEIQRHDFSHFFLENPPPVAEGGSGVVVPGCPTCRKRLNTMSQFPDHLAYDAIPPLLDRLSSQKGDPVKEMP
jgi:hypothetical protein